MLSCGRESLPPQQVAMGTTPIDQARLRLCVGEFAAPSKGHHEAAVRDWCRGQWVGGRPIEVFGLPQVIAAVRESAAQRLKEITPFLVTMRVLSAADMLVDEPR